MKYFLSNREISLNVLLWAVLICVALFVDTQSYASSVFIFIGMITAGISWILALLAGYFILERDYKIDLYLQLFRVSSVVAGLAFFSQHFSNSWEFGYNSPTLMQQMNESAMQLHLMESGSGVFVIVTGILLIRSIRAAA